MEEQFNENLELEAEYIAELDMAIKEKNGFQTLIELDRLFFAFSEEGAPSKLKTCAMELVKVRSSLSKEFAADWENKLGKQVRYSVNRVKQGKKSS